MEPLLLTESFVGAVEEGGAGDVFAGLGVEGFDVREEGVDLSAHGILTDGATAEDAFEVVLFGEGADIIFGDEDEGADDGDAEVVHGDFWQVAGEFPFIEEVHEEGLGVIIAVVAEGDGGGADAFGGIEEEFAAFAGAAIAFEGFELLVGFAGDERDVEFVADGFEVGEIDTGAAGEGAVDMDGVEGERGEAAAGDGMEEEEEGEAIFAAAEGDGEFLDPIKHFEVEEGFAYGAF